jgi:hypothetical protein
MAKLGTARHGMGSTPERSNLMDLTLEITGTAPLLMHNARLSNPRDPVARALRTISAKRGKADDDYEELAHLEFLGSLYTDPDIGPYVPGDNIFRALVDGARKHKLGVKVTSGVIVMSSVNPLAYPGPRTPEELWKDGSFTHESSVKVGMARVIRTRPVFAVWKTSASLYLDTETLDFHDLQQIVESAGRLVGLGDWRPRFGRFDGALTVTKAVS